MSDTFEKTMKHFDKMKNDLGLDSNWSMYDGGCLKADTAIFTNKQRLVRYEYVRPDATVEELDADFRDGGKRSSAEVTMLAVNGTLEALWKAADSCIRQSGTHHSYIEDFEMQTDGSLMLVTGS